MCLYPKIIKNRKYVKNKKNGGNVPTPTDPRVLMVPVGCGNCMECRKQKARQWQVRLSEEIRENKRGNDRDWETEVKTVAGKTARRYSN